jgi:hypothetical protein
MPNLADGNLSNWLLLGGVLAIAAVILRAQWRGRRREARQTLPSERMGRADAPHPRPHLPPEELSRWQVEMHDLARELSGRLDSKLALLEGLLREAREESARLERLLDEARRAGVTEGRPFEALESHAEDAGEAPLVPSSTKPRRQEEIYTLADTGHAPAEIARRLGTLVGEVELILSLRGR